VLDDGGEVDLDLGNYERFLDLTLHRDNNITTGKIYKEVIERERRGDYLGKTVQVEPHVTDAIQDWIERVAKMPVHNRYVPKFSESSSVPDNGAASSASSVSGDDDHDDEAPQICIIELGGTVGDIESMPFVEAFRQFQFRVGLKNFLNVHVSLVPEPRSTGEQKTKPTQKSVKELRGMRTWECLSYRCCFCNP